MRRDWRTGSPVSGDGVVVEDRRAEIGRLFRDLRHAIGLSPYQIAAELMTRVEYIAALEQGDFEYLPSWPETVAIVNGFAALGRVNADLVLAAMAEQFPQSVQATRFPPRPNPVLAPGLNGIPLARAKAAIVEGARQLPRQVRERPQRALYAATIPLLVLIAAVNPAMAKRAVAPIVYMSQNAMDYVHVAFPPVREGLRWIEVDDPRTRRGDKLHR